MTKRHKYGAQKVWLCGNGHAWNVASKEPYKMIACSCGSDEFHKFDSKKEARRWQELKLLEKAGKISKLERQVKFVLYAYGQRPLGAGRETPIRIRSKGYPNGRQATYTADFQYIEDGQVVLEDCKSARFKNGKSTATEASRLRMAIVEAMLGTEIRIT